MIAGPNGSGKSTLTDVLIKTGVRLGDYLNADDIARDMSGDPVEIAARAQQIVRDQRERALAERRDHAFETVMSHPSHIEYLRAAKLDGFAVRVFYVCTDDARINVERVANRVRHGGHSVPADRIRSRYERSLANLPAAVTIADTGQVFDNSFAARPLHALAHIDQGRIVLKHGLDVASIPASPAWWIGVLPTLPLKIA